MVSCYKVVRDVVTCLYNQVALRFFFFLLSLGRGPYHFPHFDARIPLFWVEEHHLGLEVYISIIPLHERPYIYIFFNHGLNETEDRQYNQGSPKQGRIKQPPRIRRIIFMTILNPPKIENRPPGF